MAIARANVGDFVDRLTALKFDNVFNPYSDISPEDDRSDAAAIRRQNLAVVLAAAIENGVDAMWIARDLGYRGGKRTGLALTDDAHIAAHGALFGTSELRRATRGPQVAERTATVIWDVLAEVGKPVFLWNVFPLHPHEFDDPSSNRTHTRSERVSARPFLVWLIDNLRPRSLVAIGRDAQQALADLGIQDDVTQVRHPSYGGQREFEQGILGAHGLAKRWPAPDLFSNF